ncbi:sex peptide receptor [Aethina tumida]|uniref:sex peptide receptor n=1 Tax=Aethina tumida TaxID=116153 RepID=UPI00096B5F49|nr:sex peptide receptor [Aethina tumida]XP_049819702.1 sex peptide receptor [Aethina tumida]XP_049819703.1 sex peptide receptor [Aethina tumida]
MGVEEYYADLHNTTYTDNMTTTTGYTYDLDLSSADPPNRSMLMPELLNITNEVPIRYAIPLFGYAMPFLLVVTVILNTLIVVVLSRRHMRTPTNVVLMAMALCDVFTLLVPSPWLIYMYTFGNHYKPLWPISLCYAWHVMYNIFPNILHTASMWLALALAVQRYIYVCHAPLARKFCTLPNVYKCLGSIMFIATVHNIFMFLDHEYVSVEVEWENRTVHLCKRETPKWVLDIENIYYGSYYIFRILFVYLIPCIVLIILNLLLFRALKQAQKRRDILLSTKKNQKSECRKQRDSNCTTLMLIVVVSVFLFVEIPLVIVTLLHVISSAFYEFLDYNMANTLILFSNFCISVSYPINFGIYCGMSRQFRETFKDLFIRGSVGARNGSSRYSIVNGPRTCTNETVL